MVETGRLPSLILWGPPGSGKTTLARALADSIDAEVAILSAVDAGVADIRLAVETARTARLAGRPTILFVDEVHRFNKSQQDALLPHVEDGILTLIGATTENPHVSVNKALLSRCRVITLTVLDDDAIGSIIDHALGDPRGYVGTVTMSDEARRHLVEVAGGDARRALNLLETAVAMATGRQVEIDDILDLNLGDVEAAAASPALRYDPTGDRHHDVVSAFIKSIRGNDPDAALYWLATMVESGEDPRFIARRIVISASEDIGNADIHALGVALDAAAAVDRVGMPEGHYALAQAVAYLASAPKSNRSGKAYDAALADVRAHGPLEVPEHVRNSPAPGSGRDYRYPGDAPEGDLDQQYLPDGLASRRYYEPTERGVEARIKERLERIRTARRRR